MKQLSIRNAAWGLALAACVGGVGGAAGGAGAALAEDFGRPPLGRYRIDTDTTTLSGQGAMVLERVQQVDGASGQLTVTDKGPPGSGPPAVRVFKGEKPNERCVGSGAPAAPPTALLPSMPLPNASCWQMGPAVTANGGSQDIDCKGVQMKLQWRRVNDVVWEMTLAGTQNPTPVGDTSTAVRAAMARMTPEQLAELDPASARVAAGGSTANAMEPVIAAMEQRIRQGTPAEQASVRSQLDTLRRTMGLGALPAPAARLRHREVWTRISGACTPG